VEAWEAGGAELGGEARGGAWGGAKLGVGRETVCREVAGVDEAVGGERQLGGGILRRGIHLHVRGARRSQGGSTSMAESWGGQPPWWMQLGVEQGG